MASIELRTTSTGTRRYAVKWRDGGRHGRAQTFTLPTIGQAETLRSLVNAAGNRTPTIEQLAPFGLAFLLDPTAGAAPEQPARPMTVADMIGRYLDALAASINAPAKRTIGEYRRYLANHIETRPLGRAIATEVTHIDIDAWQVQVSSTVAPGTNCRRPLSVESVIKVRAGVLAPAFKWACSSRSGRLLDRNPMHDSETPKAKGLFRREILHTVDEYELFLTAARSIDPEWAAMVELVAATGIRWGEAVAIEPTAVDLSRGVVNLVQRFSGGEILPGTKNGTVRTVPVPWATLDRAVGPRMGRSVLFQGPAGGRWSYASDWQRWQVVRARMAELGLSRHISAHGLRHGYATWLATQRIGDEKISMVMGHRKTSMTGRYTHLTERDLADIREAVTPLAA